MAYRDVKEYFIIMENQLLEMLGDVKDLQEAYDANQIDQEQFDQAVIEISKVRNNYERLAYIMYLFNLPKRKARQAKHAQAHQELTTFFEDEGHTVGHVVDENINVLTKLKQQIDAIKKEEKN